jgi:hypothetical protein
VAFKIPYLYDFVSKLRWQLATVILNHENINIHNIGQGKARHRKYKGLKIGGGQAYGRSDVLDCGHILGQYMSNKHNLLYKIRLTSLRTRRGRRRRRMLKKNEEKPSHKKCFMCIYRLTQSRYVTDLSSRQGGCPTTNKTATVLTTTKIWL